MLVKSREISHSMRDHTIPVNHTDKAWWNERGMLVNRSLNTPINQPCRLTIDNDSDPCQHIKIFMQQLKIYYANIIYKLFNNLCNCSYRAIDHDITNIMFFQIVNNETSYH